MTGERVAGEHVTGRRSPARWVIVVVAVVVAVGLVGGGWFAATVFASPQQRAAAAAPPVAKPVLATVVSGDLVDTQVISGVIRPTDSFGAVLTAPADASRSVVTSVNTKKGGLVTVGTAVATVNGQPVFALRSAFPLYRDLGPGDQGVDVRALQQNLVDMGLLGTADGTFGPATASAVAGLFTHAGFDVPRRDAPPAPASPAVRVAGAGTVAGGATGAGTGPVATPVQVVYFPMASALTVPSLPAVAAAVPPVGDEVGPDTTFDFTAQSMAVFATVPDSLQAAPRPGSKVTVSGAGLRDAAATVGVVVDPGSTAGDDTGSAGSGGAGAGTGAAGSAGSAAGGDTTADTQAEIRVDIDAPHRLTPEMAGQSVTVTATIRRIATAALIVPVTAVAQADSGHGNVLVVAGDGTTRRVPVTIIGAADGRVALKPGAGVKTGDQVRVG